ncbi:MAG: hypothetical protein JSR41_04660 [Proteobacteria bacterium]|uniref:hypothetical protein n=1 Tax=Pseudacidovorax intermedius TaxID=433924 RepID=UPI000344B502|nr:hypothetical protein [Pseudacidovorax intermedius]MBS0426564.1 hypothetical protein [Pseudomonadota bacterium]
MRRIVVTLLLALLSMQWGLAFAMNSDGRQHTSAGLEYLEPVTSPDVVQEHLQPGTASMAEHCAAEDVHCAHCHVQAAPAGVVSSMHSHLHATACYPRTSDAVALISTPSLIERPKWTPMR